MPALELAIFRDEGVAVSRSAAVTSLREDSQDELLLW